MSIKNFLNIPIDETPPELALSVELRCRDIMASDDTDNIKRYATHLVRHQAKQDVFLASILSYLVETEATLAIAEIRKKKEKTKNWRKFFRK
ncbi:hypothetical protein [uncultured Mediterranean phage uvMED]|nr:hypothetical protein [uncultured Mediterranean phage uvMED]